MAESFLFSQKSQGFIVKVITEADLGRWKLYSPLAKKAVLWAMTKKNTCSCIGVAPTLNIRMNTVEFWVALVSLSSQLLLQGLLTSILGPLSMVLNMCRLFLFSRLKFPFQCESSFWSFKMNFRIHTFKEELNKGILLNLNGSMPFKNSRHVNNISLFF